VPSTSYERRNQRAIQEGFGSYGKKRRLGTRLGLPGADTLLRPRNSQVLSAYPEAARRNYEASLGAVADMRREGLSTEQAAARHGLPVEVLVAFGGPALERQSDGSYAVRSADRMLRPMKVIEAGVGSRIVDVRGSRAASKVGSYWNAVNHYRDTGDDEPLRAFRGIKVGGVELETDPDVVDALIYMGVIEFETIYQVAS
jgi:hypothetical protein